MPKGVYTRSDRSAVKSIPISPNRPADVKVNIMTTSQMPDHQSANANVETLRQTHGEESTTDRLFGDLAERDKLEETDPNRTDTIDQSPKELKSEPVPQNPEEAEQPKFKEAQKSDPAPTESTPADDFIDWEKMSGKKIRQKIDGKEVIVTAEELKKYSDQDQIKKHLAEAADKVGEERRKLAEERRQIQELRQQRQSQYEAPIQNGQPQGIQQPQLSNDPVLQQILSRQQFIETQLQQMAQSTQPVIYQNNRQRVADELKGQGFGDFMDYIPKLEAHISTLQDQNLMNFYDTPAGSKALYFQLKAMDMNQKQAIVPHRTEPKAETQVIPAVQIDGGSPASGSHVDDSGHNYRAAFRRAVGSGDDKEAWNEVLRQKGILPQN